jgi:hypothetical protein
MSTAVSPGLSMLAVNSPVMVRVAARASQPGHEYTSRIEDLEAGSVVVTAPPGANSVLFASGSREIELSWMSPRGRYEQRCRLDLTSGAQKQWRLRPLRDAVLIQRRRYIRVSASVDVVIDLRGTKVPGATVDVSEGGFRVRLPRVDIPELEHTVVHAAIGGTQVSIPGYVVRSADAGEDQTEAVIAFDAGGANAAAVRRFILHRQLRARVTRDA